MRVRVFSVIDAKYVVFKHSDLEQWLADSSASSSDSNELDKLVLADATVIRGQDLLAAPLLDAYVGMLAIIIKGGNLPADQQATLQATADYFYQRAEEARDLGYKLPD